jgi:hypothetical protein
MHPNRRLLPLVFAACALWLAVSPVEAGRRWCHKDPIFMVAGVTVSVDVAVYDDQQNLVTGAVVVKLLVPPGTKAELVFVDDGFNGFGEKVTIVTDKRLRKVSHGIQIRVDVHIPAKKHIAALATVKPGSAKATSLQGTTNRSIFVNATVTPPK